VILILPAEPRFFSNKKAPIARLKVAKRKLILQSFTSAETRQELLSKTKRSKLKVAALFKCLDFGTSLPGRSSTT